MYEGGLTVAIILLRFLLLALQGLGSVGYLSLLTDILIAWEVYVLLVKNIVRHRWRRNLVWQIVGGGVARTALELSILNLMLRICE
jgi:hypothetical protein